MIVNKSKHQRPVVRSLVSANRWLRGIKTYRFPWCLTLVSANHASSNLGQALILVDTEHTVSFPVKESIDIFGMTIDNKLQFDKHVSSICKKVSNQLNVMIRFRKLISKATLIKLYKAFILPYFYYCSSVWHFCGARNTDKIEVLSKRILRFILRMPKTTTYGLRSFSYHAANQWNSLPDFSRTANFNDFKKVIANLDFM